MKYKMELSLLFLSVVFVFMTQGTVDAQEQNRKELSKENEDTIKNLQAKIRAQSDEIAHIKKEVYSTKKEIDRKIENRISSYIARIDVVVGILTVVVLVVTVGIFLIQSQVWKSVKDEKAKWDNERTKLNEQVVQLKSFIDTEVEPAKDIMKTFNGKIKDFENPIIIEDRSIARMLEIFLDQPGLPDEYKKFLIAELARLKGTRKGFST